MKLTQNEAKATQKFLGYSYKKGIKVAKKIRGKTVEHGWVQFVTPRDCTDLAQRHPSPQITEHILRGIERHAELAASGELKASRRFAPLPEKSLLAYFQAAGAEAVPELEAAQGGAAADFVAKALKKARRKKSK